MKFRDVFIVDFYVLDVVAMYAHAQLVYTFANMYVDSMQHNRLAFLCVVSMISASLLKVNLGPGLEDCQHAVIDEFLCMVAGCALGTDVMYVIGCLNKSQHGSRSTRFHFKTGLYS